MKYSIVEVLLRLLGARESHKKRDGKCWPSCSRGVINRFWSLTLFRTESQQFYRTYPGIIIIINIIIIILIVVVAVNQIQFAFRVLQESSAFH